MLKKNVKKVRHFEIISECWIVSAKYNNSTYKYYFGPSGVHEL